MSSSDDVKTETESRIVVLDFGKVSRKKIKRLRRGKGQVMDQIKMAVDEFKEAGSISPDSEVVVVTVREKSSSNKMFKLFKF
jgi:hypothetical protein